VKRLDLERHLREHGAQFLREGANHSIWWNPATRRTTSVPRHREVNDFTARKICRDLGILEPVR
jgi:mRNA interferase HicA